MTSDDSGRLRVKLVAELQRRREIRSDAVREAFLAVPREFFLAEHAAREDLAAVYRNEAILTKQTKYGHPLSSSSQPGIMALMLEQLRVEPGIRVLEFGAGAGYNAALLAVLVGDRGHVVSVDVDRAVANEARRALREGGYRVRVVHADGREGLRQGVPYDRIVVTAGAAAVPHTWFEQLTADGLLEVPLRLDGGGQIIPVFRKTRRGLRSLSAVSGGFHASSRPRRGRRRAADSRPERSDVGVMTSFGGDEAEAFLLGRVREWADRGCPGPSDLDIRVTYEEQRSRIAVKWPPKASAMS